MDIKEFFEKNNKVALAYSGGADSSYLLYAAVNSGADVTAYFVKTEFQPETELSNAIMFATSLRAAMKIIHLSSLGDEKIIENGAERCYYCKSNILKNIINVANKDGYELIIDGTNASDISCGDRPGVKALNELNVVSPFAMAGLTKEDVRRLAKDADLYVWDKPSYACLATRIAAGEPITEDKLKLTEIAEDYLLDLGFSDFRVRTKGGTAVLEITEKDMERVCLKREEILKELSPYYNKVLLNLEFRK